VLVIFMVTAPLMTQDRLFTPDGKSLARRLHRWSHHQKDASLAFRDHNKDSQETLCRVMS